jgi:hypothetical protein
LNCVVATGAESPALRKRILSAPPLPSAFSSALSDGRRGNRSPSARAATSCNMPSRQFANTIPVRSAPLMAVAGRYGPNAPHANVGMCRLSPDARFQYAEYAAFSNGMRRPAKFCANPPHDAKSSFSAVLSCVK